MQFFESKSYPTFTPVGPALVVVDTDELKRFDDLRLQLSVNGELRQNMPVEGDMLYPPVEALQALPSSSGSIPATSSSPEPRSAPHSPCTGTPTG